MIYEDIYQYLDIIKINITKSFSSSSVIQILFWFNMSKYLRSKTQNSCRPLQIQNLTRWFYCTHFSVEIVL